MSARTAPAAVVAAVVMLVTGGAVAKAPEPSCVEGISFRYCGDHVPAAKLPLRFKVNIATAPASLRDHPDFGDEVRPAIAAATAEWNRYWPILDKSVGCAGLCEAGITSAGFGRDGQNTILWGSPASCSGGTADTAAIACLFYEGTSGAAARRIVEVDIVLNENKSWRYPHARFHEGQNGLVLDNPQDAVIGEAAGAFPSPILGGSGAWHDLQSVLTHELGHALGLEDIGNTSQEWPAALSDSAIYTETMYRWYYPRTTNKRSLGAGDIAGLQFAAQDSLSDR